MPFFQLLYLNPPNGFHIIQKCQNATIQLLYLNTNSVYIIRYGRNRFLHKGNLL